MGNPANTTLDKFFRPRLMELLTAFSLGQLSLLLACNTFFKRELVLNEKIMTRRGVIREIVLALLPSLVSYDDRRAMILSKIYVLRIWVKFPVFAPFTDVLSTVI